MEHPSGKHIRTSGKPRMGPLILSHHPLCCGFDEHVVEIGGRKYCKGCLFSYPTMVATLLIGLFAPVFQNLAYTDFLVFALITLLIGLGRLIPSKSNFLSIALRMNLGLSLGFGWLSILLAPGIFHAVIIFSFFAAIHGIIAFFKWKKFFEPCRECEHYSNLPVCPGFVEKRSKTKIAFLV